MQNIPQARNERTKIQYTDLSEHRNPKSKLNRISISKFITKFEILQQDICKGSDCQCETDNLDDLKCNFDQKANRTANHIKRSPTLR